MSVQDTAYWLHDHASVEMIGLVLKVGLPAMVAAWAFNQIRKNA